MADLLAAGSSSPSKPSSAPTAGPLALINGAQAPGKAGQICTTKEIDALTGDEISKRLALLAGSTYTGMYSKPRNKYHVEDSEDEEEPEEPPGDPDPTKFMVAGPGLAGGAAGILSSVTITARDSERRRIREGGDEVTVTVVPSMGTAGLEPVEAEVQDKEGEAGRGFKWVWRVQQWKSIWAWVSLLLIAMTSLVSCYLLIGITVRTTSQGL